MESGFIIAGIFLAMGIGLGIYIGIYKVTTLDPLAEEQMKMMQEMNCDEIVEYASSGYFWSVENREFATDSARACKGGEFKAPGGHG